MRYTADSLEDIVQTMASCEKMGLLYVVQRSTELKKPKIGFGRKPREVPVWVLQVYIEEESGESEDLQGRPSEDWTHSEPTQGN